MPHDLRTFNQLSLYLIQGLAVVADLLRFVQVIYDFLLAHPACGLNEACLLAGHRLSSQKCSRALLEGGMDGGRLASRIRHSYDIS